MAQERIKEMYVVNTIIPLVFFWGVVLTYGLLGLKAFALFKLFAFVLSASLYFFILLKYLEISILQSLKEIFMPLVVPIFFIVISATLIRNFLPCEKSKYNLVIVGMAAGGVIIISFVIQYFSSCKIRAYIRNTITTRML